MSKINNLEELRPITPHENLKWVATGFITLSAIFVSFNVDWATEWWPFIGFLVGHVIWSIFAYRMREWSLFGLNFFFIFIDTYAIYIRI